MGFIEAYGDGGIGYRDRLEGGRGSGHLGSVSESADASLRCMTAETVMMLMGFWDNVITTMACIGMNLSTVSEGAVSSSPYLLACFSALYQHC